MKKWFIVLVLSTILYIGEDQGKFISGIRAEVIAFDTIYIDSDIRTYMDSVSSYGFEPTKIIFKTGIGFRNVMIYHDCTHNIDRQKSAYPGRNYISIKI